MAISFETHPSKYKHWKLNVDGAQARLTMDVSAEHSLRDGYELKLNSYDLAVDIELADAVQRLRFEHPQVKVVVVDSAVDRIFCAGANIPMLSGSKHGFKVNFCKFTNETRLYLENASTHSGLKSLAALNGTCAGGGYELALACDSMTLIDDGSSAVSLPEVPLLAVLPGTGGLTRLVDKRMVRRDLADVFCTTSEGVKGKRAVEWGLVDAIASRSQFEDKVASEAKALAETTETPRHAAASGVELPSVTVPFEDGAYRYQSVELAVDEVSRIATLTMHAPESAPEGVPADLDATCWALRAFRELDDAILNLRFNHPDVGLLVLQTRGEAAPLLAWDAYLGEHADHWFINEIIQLQSRVLRRVDLTSRSMFAMIDEGSCFVGTLLELAFAADRAYMFEDDDQNVAIQLSDANRGRHPVCTGLSRLAVRFYGHPDALEKAVAATAMLPADAALKLGLVTAIADDIDWDDDTRIFIEERASMSPDALTGMEASLRFPGPETLESKIFARLSAWQNWIFQRPNAVGPNGALTKYGQPERPQFNWERC